MDEYTLNRQVAAIARKAFGGNRETLATKTKHLQRVALSVYRQFKVGPYQWRSEHLIWAFECELGALSPGTRYRYYCYVKPALAVVGFVHDFVAFQKGQWSRPANNNESKS